MRGIPSYKKDEVGEGRKNYSSEGRRNLYIPRNDVRVIKSHITRRRKCHMRMQFWLGIMKGMDHVENLFVIYGRGYYNGF
jgi:hypothetical protein